MKKLRKLTAFALCAVTLLALVSFAACDKTPAPTPEPEKPAEYVYPGENYVFNDVNAAYSDPKYAEGTVTQFEGFTSTVHWVKNKGDNIYSLLSVANNYVAGTKLPTIICLHGLNSSYHEYDYFLPHFTAAGYAVLTFDFRGASQDKGHRSDGNIKNMTIDTQISDVRAVTDFAKTLPCVDPNKLILVGHSQGGLTGSLAAATPELKDTFKGMLLLAPGFEIVETHAAKYKDGKVPIPKLFFGYLGGDYIRSLLKHYDVYEEIKAFRKPVKILLGDKDMAFHEPAMLTAVEKYGSNASYESVPNGEHDFAKEVVDQVTPEVILPFFETLLA